MKNQTIGKKRRQPTLQLSIPDSSSVNFISKYGYSEQYYTIRDFKKTLNAHSFDIDSAWQKLKQRIRSLKQNENTSISI